MRNILHLDKKKLPNYLKKEFLKSSPIMMFRVTLKYLTPILLM